MLKYLNPFYWLPEDKTIRCGVYFLTLRDPAYDPYLPACSIDDKLTEAGGWGELNITLARLIEQFHDMVNEIQKDYPIGSEDWRLGEKYKKLYDIFIPLFFHSKVGK